MFNRGLGSVHGQHICTCVVQVHALRTLLAEQR